MLVGVMGKMGSGKTLSMSILATYLAKATKTPLAANYGLQGAAPVKSLMDITQKEREIFCFDEMWLSMDSRLWKDNVRLTQWINQTRKKKMIVFYTTQHIRQVELRARNATDVLIYCEKKPDGHWLTFIDWTYRTIGRRYLIPFDIAKKFYSLYDTYEVLKPLEWASGKKESSGYKNNNNPYGKKPYRNFNAHARVKSHYSS